MRFLKKLLIAIYLFLAAFSIALLVIFAVTGIEPTALIGCVFGVAGVESLLGAIIKAKEEKNGADSGKS